MITKKHALANNGLFPSDKEPYMVSLHTAMDEYAEARVCDFIVWLQETAYLKKAYRLLQEEVVISASEYTPEQLYQRYFNERNKAESI